jgi:hypothetical protein
MTNQKEPLVHSSEIFQIGFVVKDAERAAEYYTHNFGWGPWEIMEAEFRDYMFRDKKYDYAKQKIAFAQHGPMMIELIEPIEGETPASEFLREKGEGINHLYLGHVENLDAILEKLSESGIAPAYRTGFTMNDLTVDAVYLNTDDFGGVMLEYSQFPKGR